jgi:hypothetical protein
MEVSGQVYDPVASLSLKEPRYQIDTGLVGSQSLWGRRGEYKISYLCRKFDLDSSAVRSVALLLYFIVSLGSISALP